MNFAASAKLSETLEKLSTFMDENVYPNEARYIEEIEDGDRWQPSVLIEELKPKA